MGAAGQPQSTQLDSIKMLLVSLPWWVNFLLGFFGFIIAAPFGHFFGIPWYAAGAIGLILGFTFPHYIYRLTSLVFFVIILWVGWLLLAHYWPAEAENYRRAGERFLHNFR